MPLFSAKATAARCGAALLVLSGTTGALAQLSQQPIASTGTQAAGAPSGVRVSSLSAPAVTGNGRIGYIAGLSGLGVNGVNNRAVFAGGVGPGMSPRLLARIGTRAAGMAAGLTIASVDAPVINASGAALYTATLAGRNVTSINNRVLMISDSRSTRVLARTGAAALGMPAGTTIADIQSPMIAASGHLAFTVAVTGTGYTSANNRAVYTMAPSGVAVPQVAVRQGGQVAGMADGVVWANFATPVLSPTGELVMLGFMQGAGIDGTNDAVIWTGAGRIVARTESPLPGTAFTLRTFSPPSITGGTIGFVAGFDGAGAELGEFGVLSESDGTLSVVARTEQSDPSMDSAATWFMFGQPALAAGGRVAFLATMAGEGVTAGTNDLGLWASSGTGLTLVARTGGAVPGTTDAFFDTISQPTVSASGHAVFSATLRGTGITTSNNTALFAWHARTGLLTVARTGRPMQIGGATRIPVQLSTMIGSDSRPNCLTQAGMLVYLVRTAEASIMVRTTLPASFADIAGPAGRGADGIVDQHDLTAFISAFSAGSVFADVTGVTGMQRDGRVTTADLQAFNSEYSSMAVSSGR